MKMTVASPTCASIHFKNSYRQVMDQGMTVKVNHNYHVLGYAYLTDIYFVRIQLQMRLL